MCVLRGITGHSRDKVPQSGPAYDELHDSDSSSDEDEMDGDVLDAIAQAHHQLHLHAQAAAHQHHVQHMQHMQHMHNQHQHHDAAHNPANPPHYQQQHQPDHAAPDAQQLHDQLQQLHQQLHQQHHQQHQHLQHQHQHQHQPHHQHQPQPHGPDDADAGGAADSDGSADLAADPPRRQVCAADNLWTTVTHMKHRRYGLGVCAAGTKIYVVGGTVCGQRSLGVGEVYDTEAGTWSDLPPLLTSRCHHGLCTISGKIYAVGGWNQQVGVLNTIEVYDHALGEWSELPPMAEQRGGGVGVCAFEGKIYVCGGNSGSSRFGNRLATVEVFDPEAQEWAAGPPMGTGRGGVGVCATATQLFAVGGRNDETLLRSAEVLDRRTRAWVPLPDMRSTRSAFKVCAVDGYVFAVGGYSRRTCWSTVERLDAAVFRAFWTPRLHHRHDRRMRAFILSTLQIAYRFPYRHKFFLPTDCWLLLLGFVRDGDFSLGDAQRAASELDATADA